MKFIKKLISKGRETHIKIQILKVSLCYTPIAPLVNIMTYKSKY